MPYRLPIWCALSLVLVVLSATPPRAQSIDPHALYERSCAQCHAEHARDFAEKRLALGSDGALFGQSGAPLGAFLASGHGGLGPDEIDIMLELLKAIVRGHGLYEKKCRSCHDRAHDLARLKLVVRDNKLVGRYTDRDIAAFLSYHGRLTPAEVPFMVETLRRQIQPGSTVAD